MSTATLFVVCYVIGALLIAGVFYILSPERALDSAHARFAFHWLCVSTVLYTVVGVFFEDRIDRLLSSSAEDCIMAGIVVLASSVACNLAGLAAALGLAQRKLISD